MNHNISSADWTLEHGYVNNDLDVYPRRAIGTGVRSGLSLPFSMPRNNVEYTCAGPYQGFRVSIHNPGEVPRVTDHNFRVPLSQDVTATVVATMITTDESLSSYHPETRQCFFNHERNLKFFQFYTQKNCEFECLTNYTLTRCGCVKFSMPRYFDTIICDWSDIYCYNTAESNFMAEDLRMKFGKTLNDHTCNCLPSCTSISYGIETSQGDYESDAQSNEFLSEVPAIRRAELKIYFKDMQFTTLRRSELYGWIDFIANCGGLLGTLSYWTRDMKTRVQLLTISGLFIGISVLSVVDLVYYFTMRLGFLSAAKNK